MYLTYFTVCFAPALSVLPSSQSLFDPKAAGEMDAIAGAGVRINVGAREANSLAAIASNAAVLAVIAAAGLLTSCVLCL
jgi:hypothetical protein